MELELIIQKPLSLISFKVVPLPQRAALRWQNLAINSVTLDFFGKIMGCIYSSSNSDLLIRPPIIMPFPSINGSMEHNALASPKLFFFCFSLPSSSLKCFAWTYLIMPSLASCSILHWLMQWAPCCLLVLRSFVWYFVIINPSASKYGLQLSSFLPSLIFFFPVVTVGLV